MRRAVAAAVLLVSLSLPSTALSYGGPWDSAHEPPTVTNPGVVVDAVSGAVGTSGFSIKLSYSLTCPSGAANPVTVTFSDPTGSISDVLSDPCNGQWASNPSDENNGFDFGTGPIPGASVIVDPQAATDPTIWPSDSFDVGMVSGTDPFLFTVSSAAGIVAQQAYTWTESNNYSATIIDERHHIDQFINVCIDDGYTLYSENGGDLYCVVYSGSGTTTWTPGWPPPPVPKPFTLSLADARYAVRAAVHDISRHPQQLKLSRCIPLTLTRWRCSVSWHDATYSYAGAITVSDPGPAIKYYDVGWNIRQTKLDCKRACTRHVVVG